MFKSDTHRRKLRAMMAVLSLVLAVSAVPVLAGYSPYPQSGKETSTTYAAISPAIIDIRDEAAQKAKTGQTAEETLAGLSRDPSQANNALAKIFDQKKVEETQELTRVFGEEAYKAVGDLAKSQTKDYEKAKLQDQSAGSYLDLKAKEANGTLTTEDRTLLANYEQAGFNPTLAENTREQARNDMARLQGQYDAWKDGSITKIALHGLVGAIQTGFGGGNAGYGAIAAGTSEKLNTTIADYLDQQYPDLSAAEKKNLQQLTSLVIGATAVKLAGGDTTAVQGGAVTALQGESFNRQLHLSEQQLLRDKAKELAAADPRQQGEKYWYALLVSEAQAKVDYEDHLSREDYLATIGKSLDPQHTYVGEDFVPGYLKDAETARSAITRMQGQPIYGLNGKQIYADGAYLTTFQSNSALQYVDHRLFGAGTSGLETLDQFGSYAAARDAQAFESGRESGGARNAAEKADQTRLEKALTRNGSVANSTADLDAALILVPGARVAAEALGKAVGALPKEIIKLAESNITNTGETVLGSYRGYIDKASGRGASYFDIGNAWNGLSREQQWTANSHFLDIIAGRGDQVFLSVSKESIQPGTWLAKEVQYLITQKNYRWVNQWSLKPGP